MTVCVTRLKSYPLEPNMNIIARKINDLIFSFSYFGKTYLVRTYPFKIVKIDSKLLTDKDIHEGAKLLHRESIDCDFFQTPPQSYYLPLAIITNACNLKCDYCYAWEGSYGKSIHNMTMSTFDRIINLHQKYLSQIKTKTTIEVGVVLFGGEPTLNFDLIKYAVRNIKTLSEKLTSECIPDFTPRITINTNGYSLSDDLIKFASCYNNCVEFVVSYDGLMHDNFRKDTSGNGTAKLVESNIKRLIRAGFNPDITTVVSPNGMKKFVKNVEYITDKFSKKIHINPSFVRGPISDVKSKAVYPGVLEQEYTTDIVQQWGEDTKQLILDGYSIYTKRFFQRISEGGYLYRCPAMLYEFCVDARGEVYPCHNFTDDKFHLGNINDRDFSLVNKSISDVFFKRKLTEIKPCSECIFQTICLSSFDCPAHSLHDLGDFYKVDERFCSAAKLIMEALLVQFIESQG